MSLHRFALPLAAAAATLLSAPVANAAAPTPEAPRCLLVDATPDLVGTQLQAKVSCPALLAGHVGDVTVTTHGSSPQELGNTRFVAKAGLQTVPVNLPAVQRQPLQADGKLLLVTRVSMLGAPTTGGLVWVTP